MSRSYSSDSLGSDRVFADEGYYQGMLKATDERKGRVTRKGLTVLNLTTRKPGERISFFFKQNLIRKVCVVI